MGTPSIGFALFLIVSAIVLLWAVGAIIYIARIRRLKRRLADGPICGACGYAASIGPDGFTRCPECGGEYAVVGILGPNTRTTNPAILISAGLGWVLAIALFGAISTAAITKWLSVTLSTATVNQSANWAGNGLDLAIDLTTTTNSISGRPAPTSDTTQVQLAAGARRITFTIDNLTDSITQSNSAALPVGRPITRAELDALTAELLPSAQPRDLAYFQTETADTILKRTSGRGLPMFGSRSSSNSGFRNGFSSGSSSSSSSTAAGGYVSIGNWVFPALVLVTALAAVFLIIAVLGLLYLARTARSPKPSPK